MSFATVKLPNEPIIIVTGDVPLEEHLEPLHATFAQIDRIASELQTPLYCIYDSTRLTNISFSDILIWLDEQRTAPPGSVRDPRLRPIVVGTHDMLSVLVRKTLQQFGVEMPIHATLDEALEAIRSGLNAAH